MKNLIFYAILLLSVKQAIAQVGIGTTTPNASSSLDISSTNSGLLIPRVSLVNVTNGTTPINSPATSLLVYNTNAGVASGNGVGYYYWNGTLWVNLSTSDNNDWNVNGNSGTNPTNNFIGTTDDNDLVFKRNNIIAGKITTSNTSFGENVLSANTTGYNNTVIGANSLTSNTDGYFNTASGFSALYSNTSGDYNTASGCFSLYSNTTGESNVAIGEETLYSNTSGLQNTAIGERALYSNTIGVANTASGFRSLHSNTNGFFNTANGYFSLNNNITGSNNTANGSFSLESNTIGTRNTANGQGTLSYNISGNDNTANGFLSLTKNISGNNNTASGINSLQANTTGSNNSSFGEFSMFENTTGNNNTAYGGKTLSLNTTGNLNTAIGYYSLQNNTTGDNNIGIGYNALYNIVGGSNNIGIGYLADVPDPNGSYQMSIANVIYGKDLFSFSSGKIGIGTNNPSSTLNINGQVTIDQKNFGGYGGLLIKGNAPGYNYPNIAFSTLNDNGFDEIAAYIGGTINDNTSGSEAMDINFLTSTNGLAGLSEKMRIKDNGNVGIGTTTPSEKLDIVGKIKITDGTEGNNRILTSDATGVAYWKESNATKQPVEGVFIGIGANIGAGTPVGAFSSASSYCNTYIDLPPGKWMVFGTYLLHSDQYFPNLPLGTGQSVWVRFAFSSSNITNTPTSDVISGGLISGVLAGPNEFGLANGQTIIENPNPPNGAVKRYYVWAAVAKYGTTPTSFYVDGVAGSWGENQLTAIPMN